MLIPTVLLHILPLRNLVAFRYFMNRIFASPVVLTAVLACTFALPSLGQSTLPSDQSDNQNGSNSSGNSTSGSSYDSGSSNDPYSSGNTSGINQNGINQNGSNQNRTNLNGTSSDSFNLPDITWGDTTTSTQNGSSGRTSDQQTPTTNLRPLQPQVPPPPVITDFQRMVQASTGQMLPIFGQNLFESPSTFSPVSNIPVTPEYVIAPGDEVIVRIWGSISITQRIIVDRAGDIFLPRVGTLHVAGLRYSELESHLKSSVDRVFRNYELSAQLGQLHAIQIFVLGAAKRPGAYTVSSLSTLVNAIFASGGPSSEGSMRRIELRRESKTVSSFDLYDLIINGHTNNDSRLLPGDVLYIPPAGPRVALSGSVKVPAIYEATDTSTLQQVLEYAGGFNTTASLQVGTLERIQDHRERVVTNLSFTSAGLSIPVRDGDLIRIRTVSRRYSAGITLRGNVETPGRFAWHEGMRLHEIIPDRASLLTPDYWQRRTKESLPTPFFTPMDQVSAGDRTASSAVQSSSNTSGTSTRLTGRENVSRPLAPLNVVQIPAAEINWNYAVIERTDATTLKHELIPFHLGRLVFDHNDADDLELLPNDTVTIFSQADFQVPILDRTKYVRLEGEVVNAGIYSVEKGETLRHLLIRVGGLTPNAYLYASQLKRESTRFQQQSRLEEYLSKLQIEQEHSATNRALSSSNQSADALLRTTQQNVLNRIRDLRASGRVLLSFKPSSSNLADVPDIPLEDGDVFTVANRPAIISIIGSVYSQNSVLYVPGANVKYALRMAGGPDRNSDRKHTFIIRADGTVTSKDNRSWGDNFNSVKLYPGDTVVVPEQLYPTPILQQLTSIASIFGQIGIAAAVVR